MAYDVRRGDKKFLLVSDDLRHEATEEELYASSDRAIQYRGCGSALGCGGATCAPSRDDNVPSRCAVFENCVRACVESRKIKEARARSRRTG